jgi:hypothetical protein
MADRNSLTRLGSQLAQGEQRMKTLEALVVTGPDGREARVCFLLGRIIGASADGLEGDQAVMAAVQLSTGRAKLRWAPDESRPQRGLTLSVGDVLEQIAMAAGRDEYGDGELAADPFGRAPAERNLFNQFPPLPKGPAVFLTAPVTVHPYTTVLTELADPTLLVLSAEDCRACSVIVRGHTVDALWIDQFGVATGRRAAVGFQTVDHGAMSAFLVDEEVLNLLPLLWRVPLQHDALPAAWLDPDMFLEALVGGSGTHAVTVTDEEGGRLVGLFEDGRFVASFEDGRTSAPDRSVSRLRERLGMPGALVGVRSVQPAAGQVHQVDDEALHAPVPDAAPTTAEADPVAALDEGPLKDDPAPEVDVAVELVDTGSAGAGEEEAAEASGIAAPLAQPTAPPLLAPPPPPPTSVAAAGAWAIDDSAPTDREVQRWQERGVAVAEAPRLPDLPASTADGDLSEFRPADVASLQFYEFHTTLYKALRAEGGLDDERAQLICNLFAQMGGTPTGVERALGQLDKMVVFGLPAESVPALRVLVNRLVRELF